jgi:hypothetical protein
MEFLMKRFLGVVAFAVAVLAVSLDAMASQAVNSEKLIAVMVVVKTPPGITRAAIDEGFVKAVPTYQKIPGLMRKYFIVNDDGFGGMYLWKSRAAAEAWFTPEFVAKSKARYGTEPQIIYFDTPIQLDNSPSPSGG